MAVQGVFAKRLKEARKRKGISQKQLGILAGIDEFAASPRVNQYERDKHLPDLEMAERLASALGVPPPYLFARDDELANWILAYTEMTSSARLRLIKGLSSKKN